MNEPNSTPPVSGVDEQILAQHRRIRDLTRQLENTGELREFLARLDDLRSALIEHFLGEEAAGGFYDTIRSMTPRQLALVDQLEKEHEAFLASIDALAARARACLAGPVAEVLGEARVLTSRLREHEAAEDNVLIDTLYADLGQGD